MSPESDGNADGDIRTIGCTLEKIHIRRCLNENPESDFSYVFNRSWILKAYNEVTTGKRKLDSTPELQYTKKYYMPDFTPPSRSGIQQCMLYDAGNMATVAENNIYIKKDKVRGVLRVFAPPTYYYI